MKITKIDKDKVIHELLLALNNSLARLQMSIREHEQTPENKHPEKNYRDYAEGLKTFDKYKHFLTKRG